MPYGWAEAKYPGLTKFSTKPIGESKHQINYALDQVQQEKSLLGGTDQYGYHDVISEQKRNINLVNI